MTSAIAQALSAALLHFFWQGLVVAFLLWVALFALRKRSADSRYLASCVALTALVVMPAITAALLYRGPAPVAPAVELAPLAPAATANVLEKAATSSREWIAGWESWIVPIWSAGVLLFSIRLIWGCRQVSSLRRRGTPAEEPIVAAVARIEARLGITRRVHVIISSIAEGPSVVGWVRPVILLPTATLLGLTTEQLEAVLAHELAHVRRHDYLVNVVQVVVESLLFYHPAVWWISSRIRQERELCCDDLAVSSCGDALCYARALSRLEKMRATPSLAMAGTGGPLLYRIQRLVGGRTTEYGPSKLSGILALSLGIACLAMNVQWARGQAQENKLTWTAAIAVADRVEPDAHGVNINLNGAELLHRSSVEYPRTAIEKSIQGSVTVEATLDSDGSVSDARVVSGPAELRRAVLQSVLEWHFSPALAGSTRQVTAAFDLSAAQQHLAKEREERGRSVSVQGKEFTVLVDHPERGEHTVELDRVGKEMVRQQQLEELRSQKGVFEYQLKNFDQQAAATELGKKEMEARLAETHASLEAISAEPRAVTLHYLPTESSITPKEAVGKRLAQIDAVGFSDTLRRTILSRLPVQIGDTLSQESIERIAATLARFDEHHEYRPFWKLVPTATGDYALHISAPNRHE